MKKLATLTLVLAVLGLALPPLLGVYAQRQMQVQIDALNHANSPLRFELRAFNRDWFSSRVALRVAFAPEAAVRFDIDGLNLNVEVDHGPLGLEHGWFLYRTLTHLDDEVAPSVAAFLALANLPYLLEIQTHTTLAGDTSVEAFVPPFHWTTGDGIQMEFAGMFSEGLIDVATRRVQIKGEARALAVNSALGDFALRGLQFSGDQRASTGDVWVGPAEINLESLGYTPKNPVQASLDLQGLVVKQETSMKAGALSSSAHYSLGLLHFGAASKLSDLALQFTLHNVDVNAITTTNLHRLLERSPLFDLQRLRFAYNNEPVDVRLTVAVDPISLPAESLFDPRDVAMWQQLLSVEADVVIGQTLALELAARGVASQLQASLPMGSEVTPKQLRDMAAVQAGTMLASLVQQGLLRQSEEGYLTRVTYTDGELTTNGVALPLPALLGLSEP